MQQIHRHRAFQLHPEQIQGSSILDLRNECMVIHRIREDIEKAKTDLFPTSQTQINPSFITIDASGARHINSKIQRLQFEAPLWLPTSKPPSSKSRSTGVNVTSYGTTSSSRTSSSSIFLPLLLFDLTTYIVFVWFLRLCRLHRFSTLP